jgi:hypothetical protein
MTLKEKFKKTLSKDFTINQLEQIADEFAIEFAEWVLNRALGESGLELKDDTLNKFKKEKGL